MLSQWLLMKVFQVVLYGLSGSGSRPWPNITRRTVCQDTSYFSFFNSPWMWP